MVENVLVGYDNRGIVIDSGDCIIRKINPEYSIATREYFELFKQYDLTRIGFVKTAILDANTPDDLTLVHEKHIISYPYEWTANMLKDAALFHLKLFIELDKYGLTLKDALPNNILFNCTEPVFVDFLSLVPSKRLHLEKWLDVNLKSGDFRFAVFDSMFVPYILLPLLSLGFGNYSQARYLLSEKICNGKNGSPSWKDVYVQQKWFESFGKWCKQLAKKILRISAPTTGARRKIKAMRKLVNSSRVNYVAFCEKLYRAIDLLEVTPSDSAYKDYYKLKKESYELVDQKDWKDKQRNVCVVLNKVQPKRVLDLGANTGWFSFLAEHLGAEVIATDIDESSIDSLYLFAKSQKLKILPLLLSFDDLTRELYGIVDRDPVYAGRDFVDTPLCTAPISRLTADVVLCLGLVHHLILGEGKSIAEVLSILSKLTNDTLVLEFVEFNDQLIMNNRSFFANIDKYTSDTYNLEVFVASCRKHFVEVEILASTPNTRKLLVCKK